MIPQAFIQELLARVDVVDVVGKYVRLKKGGANWLGLCPFHGEKSPSFTVSPSKQFYHCFGCGAHCSAVGFLMAHAGMGYRDAVADLARSVGLTVPDDRGDEGARQPVAGALDMLAAAARFYAGRLRDAPAAIAYLKGRGLTGEVAARFGIGYAPAGWRGLEAAVPDYGVVTLVEAGLVVESEPESGEGAAQGRRYDRFRDRIMFPIRNARGQVIGFGGRVLGQGEPKYLNSPETALFSKGRELYGVYEARDAIRAQNCVIVVEGYMDVVMLAQHGVRHAVATLGTATTAQHVQKLLRLADRVVFSFDGDAAGRRAAWRALEACLPQASDVKRLDFLLLPAGHDPDSLVRQGGAAGFAEVLQGVQSLSEFLLSELAVRNDLQTPEGRARLQAEARPLLRTMPPIALRVQLLNAVAARVGVRPEDVARYVDDDASFGGSAGARPAVVEVPSAVSGRPPPGDRTAALGSEQSAAPGGRPPWTGGRRWSGRGRGDRDRWPPVPRLPVALPDLQRRARLLLALHPAVARDAWPTDFLPLAIVDWLARVAALPPGATFEALLVSLRGEAPELAEVLSAEAAQDRGLLAELGLEEARREFAGALNQLRVQQIRDEVDQLAAAGLEGEAQRLRYAELLALRKSFTS